MKNIISEINNLIKESQSVSLVVDEISKDKDIKKQKKWIIQKNWQY